MNKRQRMLAASLRRFVIVILSTCIAVFALPSGAQQLYINPVTFGANRTCGADATAAIQASINFVNTNNGGEVRFPPGCYLANNLTLSDHVILRGPLVNAGAWWGTTGKGATIRNTHATNNTINGAGGASASLSSAVIGLAFESTTTSGAHIALPDTSNHVLIEGNSFQGATNGIKTSGTTYDLTIRRNFFFGQTGPSLSKNANGGVSINIIENYFRGGGVAGDLQAIVLPNGGGAELIWNVTNNIFTGYKGAGVAVFDTSSQSIRGATFSGNQFEGNNAANAWCLIANGSGWNIFGNEFDSSTKAIEANTLTDSVIGSNTFSSLSSFAIQLDAGTARTVVMPQLNSGGAAITDSGTAGTNSLINLSAVPTRVRGTFTATITGMTATVTATANYTILDNTVTLDLPSALNGTSNTTACTITGLPAALQPTSTKSWVILTMDSGTSTPSQALLTGGTGTITLYKGTTPSATFTNSGAKGLGSSASVTYTLN